MLSSDDALDGCVGTMRRLREEFAFALRSGPRVPRWSLNNTGARHSRHARSRSHHGHRSATVTPESLQADVGPWTRLRGDGRSWECFDLSEAEWEVQARSVRSEQRDAKGRALQSPGEGDCERSWL